MSLFNGYHIITLRVLFFIMNLIRKFSNLSRPFPRPIDGLDAVFTAENDVGRVSDPKEEARVGLNHEPLLVGVHFRHTPVGHQKMRYMAFPDRGRTS
jgi:hypothetical protein